MFEFCLREGSEKVTKWDRIADKWVIIVFWKFMSLIGPCSFRLSLSLQRKLLCYSSSKVAACIWNSMASGWICQVLQRAVGCFESFSIFKLFLWYFSKFRLFSSYFHAHCRIGKLSGVRTADPPRQHSGRGWVPKWLGCRRNWLTEERPESSIIQPYHAIPAIHCYWLGSYPVVW